MTRTDIFLRQKFFNVFLETTFLHVSCYPVGRGGGGVRPDFFVKFDLEIAIDQQTRACDQTFEGVPDSGCPPVPAGQPRPFWSKLCPIMPNHLKMLITKGSRLSIPNLHVVWPGWH